MGLPVEAELFVLQVSDDLFDAQLRRTDALATEFDEFCRALHVCRQLVDVDIVSVEQLENLFQFRDRLGISQFQIGRAHV